jgi:hypothetical protein
MNSVYWRGNVIPPLDPKSFEVLACDNGCRGCDDDRCLWECPQRDGTAPTLDDDCWTLHGSP